MQKETPHRRRRTAKKAAVSREPSARAESAKTDQYIADQLKAMYDSVTVEPIPDRLLQLLDRLGKDTEE